MKSFIRKTKADESTKRKVDKAIRRGWQPGMRVSDFLDSKKRRRFQ